MATTALLRSWVDDVVLLCKLGNCGKMRHEQYKEFSHLAAFFADSYRTSGPRLSLVRPRDRTIQHCLSVLMLASRLGFSEEAFPAVALAAVARPRLRRLRPTSPVEVITSVQRRRRWSRD